MADIDNSNSDIAKDALLATILKLAGRARAESSVPALRFLLLNETKALVDYRQAAFWSEESGVVGVSGISSFEKHSPYIDWLNLWFLKAPKGEKIHAYQTDLTLLEKKNDAWRQWMPRFVCVVDLPCTIQTGYKVLYARDSQFTQDELTLLSEWLEIWFHEFGRYSFNHKRRFPFFKRFSRRSGKRILKLAILVLLLVAGQIPVTQSILAPAELVPLNPNIVRAPLDGIIEKIMVKPSQRVEVGDVLLTFDNQALKNQMLTAQQEKLTSEAEYKAMAQRALFNADSKAQLAVLKSRVDEKALEVEHLTNMFERSLVKASRPGLVLIEDVDSWSGKPVMTGQRIMVVADEKEVVVETWISPKDVISFPDSTAVTVFLSADPTRSIIATLNYLAYQPELRPDGLYAYRARATINDDVNLNVGLKGTAKLEGESVPLWYWLARRPLASLRTWLGV